MFQGYSEAEYYERMDDYAPAPSVSEQVSEFVRNHGALETDREWISTPFDTWEKNPFFTGTPGRHPEDFDEGDFDDVEPPPEPEPEPEPEPAKPMTRKQELLAGRCYNRMNDTECGGDDLDQDPTGEAGWTRMTQVCDIRACSGEQSYEAYLAELVSDVITGYPEEVELP